MTAPASRGTEEEKGFPRAAPEPGTMPEPPAAAESRPGSPARRLMGLVLRLMATALVTWFIFRAIGVNLQELGTLDWTRLELSWGLLGFSGGILLLGYVYSAGLWGLMVREMGGPEVPLLRSLRVFFTANLGRYIPGKLWQIAGLALLARKEGVSPATATGAAVLGQLFALGGATVVGAGVLFGGQDLVGLGADWVAAGILAVMVLATFPRILRPLLQRLLRRAGAETPGRLWPDQAFGIRWLLLHAVSWLIQGGAFLVFLAAFGVEMGGVEGMAVFPAAYLLGYIAFFAPAGLGVREGSLVFFLTPIAGPQATVLAVLARLWTTVVELVPALILAGGYMPGSRTNQGVEGPGG